MVDAAFFGVDSVAGGAWLKATSDASAWAGFELWGDFAQNGQAPQFLSGINAAFSGSNNTGGSGAPPRTIIQETDAVHNNWDTAQELTAINGGWNHNVVGDIEQDGGTGPVFNFPPYSDAIEDIYTFTLTEATPLLIAANADNPAVDIDLIVVKDVSTRTDFYPDRQEYLDDIDWSAAGGGLESVAHVFQPGTYYILVTHYEGDVYAGGDYGLLVTSYPLMLNTFDTADSLDDFSFLGGATDSDGFHSWVWTDILSDYKYGPAIVQVGPEIGMIESSLALSPFIDVPATGLTVFDFDFAAVGNQIGDGDGMLVGISDTLFNVTTTEGVTYSILAQPNTVDVNGTNVAIYDFFNWASSFSENGTFQTNYTFNPTQAGERLSVGFFGVTSAESWIVDNARTYNMQTTANPAKAKKAGRLVVPRRGAKKQPRAMPARLGPVWPTGRVDAKN